MINRVVSKMVLIGLISWTFFTVSAMAASLNVSPSNANLQYRGRINFANASAPIFYWPGTEVAIAFQGSGLTVTLTSSDANNYMTVLVDGVIAKTNLNLSTNGSGTYTLASGLADT